MTPLHHAINYVEITVTDMDAAQHFYGAASAGGSPTMRRLTLASRRKGDGEVGGLSLGQNVEPGGPLVLLYSDDLDATVAAVKDAGGTIAEAVPHSRADGACSIRAGTGSAYGAQPRQPAVQEERSGRMLIRRRAVGPYRRPVCRLPTGIPFPWERVSHAEPLTAPQRAVLDCDAQLSSPPWRRRPAPAWSRLARSGRLAGASAAVRAPQARC